MLRGATSEARPLRLNTGRIRDQWHTMTRTGLSPRLGQHLPEPYVEIHPSDAVQADIVDGGYARLATDLGQCILKVVVSERQQRGMLFAPIHWSEENSAYGRVGALVAPFTDPFSGQPENKATPVAIEAVIFAQRGFVLSRKPMSFPKGVWWSRVAVTGGYGYLIASNLEMANWKTQLSPQGEAGHVAEYEDPALGVYRVAHFDGERLEAVLFVGPVDTSLNWDAVRARSQPKQSAMSSVVCCCQASPPMAWQTTAPWSAHASGRAQYDLWCNRRWIAHSWRSAQS
jgi:assimilatory nitrate reductase catalytic subunit